jgi:glycosyltransferase involved in cell wall biosynthesis
MRRQVDVVLTGDALTYAVVGPLARLFRVRHATMIMGLDVTYDNALYRKLVLSQLRRASLVIAISAATADTARMQGVEADHLSVVRLGIPALTTPLDRVSARLSLHARLAIPHDDVVLLTLGRLVRRKGARWFVDEVLPQLPPNVHYVIAGAGPELAPLQDSVATHNLEGRVVLLGHVDDQLREELLQGADLFVQPNIEVAGDLEGFGLVTVEAALRGTVVVAADLEGIKDAVVDAETGFLLPSADADAWVARLRELIADPALGDSAASFAAAAARLFSEAAMGAELCRLLKLTVR